MELSRDRDPTKNALADSTRGGARQTRKVEMGEVSSGNNAAEDRDSEWSTDLVDRLQRSRADAAAIGRELDERRGGRGGQGETHPGPDDHHPDRHEQPT